MGNSKIGVLIAQLGTPSAPTGKALRPYLKKFLGDPRVIEKPRWLWWFVLHFAILPKRPARSARLYKRIWTEEGSPLEVNTKRTVNRIREELQKIDSNIIVEYGMRYSEPFLSKTIDLLIEKGCEKILLFNMYPQYSGTTVGSNYDAVFLHFLKRRVVPTLRVVEPYFSHPAYISALAQTINSSIANMKNKPQQLVFSYHGIPEKYVKKGDIYCSHCEETTKSLLPLLDIDKSKIIHTYQSRFGRDPWLEPYTDETIEELAKNGIKNIAVACPGFTADCLETLDELGNEAREAFYRLGGNEFCLIPCLNDQEPWIEAMTSIITSELGSWLNTSTHGYKTGCALQIQN